MGNRACVVFTDGREFSPAIYLHWNGGPESVYATVDPLRRDRVYCGLGNAMTSVSRATDNVLTEQGCSFRMPVGGAHEA